MKWKTKIYWKVILYFANIYAHILHIQNAHINHAKGAKMALFMFLFSSHSITNYISL